MKMLVIITSLMLNSLSYSAQFNPDVCSDPRTSFASKVFSNGEKVIDNGSFVIIAWSGTNTKYQIWGNDTRMTKADLEVTLKIIMAKSARNIYVMGNNWGAGLELSEMVQALSKKHSIDAYFGSPSAFTKVSFKNESKETKSIIAKSIIKMQNKAQ